MDSELRSIFKQLQEYKLFVPANRAILGLDRGDTKIIPSCAVLPPNEILLRRLLLKQGTGCGISLEGVHFSRPSILGICKEPRKLPDGRIPGIMMTLHWENPKAVDFMSCKRRPLTDLNFQNMNISLIVSHEEVDDLMSSPIFPLIQQNILGCGDPGFIFSRNRQQAAVPCGELLLEPFEACTVGVLNLMEHSHENGTPNEAKMAETLHAAVPALDKLIDCLDVPSERMLEVIQKNRRLGMGVAGWADVLNKKAHLQYDSPEAVELASVWARAFSRAAHDADPHPARESLLAFPPTTHTSERLGSVSFSIEPYFDEAIKISPEAHIRMLAAWQYYIDGSISKTVNVRKECEDIAGPLRLASELGCKGVTFYRDGSIPREQPEEHGHSCTKNGVCE